MARYTATVQSISNDGTSLYVEIRVFNGLNDQPPIIVSFPTETSASDIRDYIQTIVDNQPTLRSELNDLVGVTLRGTTS